MSTHETAVTQYVIADGIKFAYRRLGTRDGIPLVMLIHFRGNMDFWDPALIDALARSRPILLLDYSGLGKSEGEIQTSFQGWAANVLAVINALQIRKVDLLGFSMYVFLSLEQLPTDTNYIGEEQLPNMLSSRHQASCVGLSSPEPAQAVHQTHYSAQNTFSWPW